MIAIFKPVASAKTRIFVAAMIWSCVGLMLMWRGWHAVVGSGREWLLLISLVIGTFKSWAVLDKVALKNVTRILDKGEYSCLGGVYSWKTWLSVLGMIGLGRLLRASPLQVWLVGLLYVTVGWGLFWSSRKVWMRLRKIPPRAGSESGGNQSDAER